MVQNTINERFGEPVELQVADGEWRLSAHSVDLTLCPTLYWKMRGCDFVSVETGRQGYRPQFFYGVREAYGTGPPEYPDLADRVLALLQAQADHGLKRTGVAPVASVARGPVGL